MVLTSDPADDHPARLLRSMRMCMCVCVFVGGGGSCFKYGSMRQSSAGCLGPELSVWLRVRWRVPASTKAERFLEDDVGDHVILRGMRELWLSQGILWLSMLIPVSAWTLQLDQ